MRYFVSIISGLAVGGLLVALIQVTGKTIYFDDLMQDATDEVLRMMPSGYYRFIIVSHILGAFGAGLVTSLINKNYRLQLGLLTAGIILAGTVYHNIVMPYPGWARAMDISLTAFAGMAGSWIGIGRQK